MNRFYRKTILLLLLIACGCNAKPEQSVGDNLDATCKQRNGVDEVNCLFDNGDDNAANKLLEDLAASGDVNSKHFYISKYIDGYDSEKKAMAIKYERDLAFNNDLISMNYYIDREIRENNMQKIVEMKCRLHPKLSESDLDFIYENEKMGVEPDAIGMASRIISKSFHEQNIGSPSRSGSGEFRAFMLKNVSSFALDELLTSKCD